MKRLAAALLVVLSACGSSSNASSNTATTSTTTAEEALAIDGPVIRYPHQSSASAQLSSLVQGQLEFDADCLYLVVGHVGRFPILWPADTRWNAQDKSVVLSDGRQLHMGASVNGSGGYFYLSDVDLLAGAAASAVARDCLDNSFGQIAVMRNDTTIIHATS